MATQPPNSRAAGRALTRSIIQLMNTMRIPVPALTEFEPGSEWMLQKPMGLSALLNLRLLYVPSVELDNEGAPKVKDSSLARHICTAISTGLNIQQIWDGWIERKDFRFLEKLSNMDKHSLVQDFQEAIIRARADLAETLGLAPGNPEAAGLASTWGLKHHDRKAHRLAHGPVAEMKGSETYLKPPGP